MKNHFLLFSLLFFFFSFFLKAENSCMPVPRWSPANSQCSAEKNEELLSEAQEAPLTLPLHTQKTTPSRRKGPNPENNPKKHFNLLKKFSIPENQKTSTPFKTPNSLGLNSPKGIKAKLAKLLFKKATYDGYCMFCNPFEQLADRWSDMRPSSSNSCMAPCYAILTPIMMIAFFFVALYYTFLALLYLSLAITLLTLIFLLALALSGIALTFVPVLTSILIATCLVITGHAFLCTMRC